MDKFSKYTAVALAVMSIAACTRVETGEIGVRVGFDKQIKPGELMPGSFNQTIIGDVLTFPVKDVNVVVENLTPVAKDNSTMQDLDVVVVYNINPNEVAELYATKNRSFHTEYKGDVYLMYNYIVQNTRNAVYKAARKYDALDMADNREAMETYIKEEIMRNLAEEKLDGSITISQVLIRNIMPAVSVVESANALVRAKNEYKQKEVEVQTAKKEAERMTALANQGSQSIAYMNAQADLNYSEAAKAGKINTIIVPRDFKGQVVVGK